MASFVRLGLGLGVMGVLVAACGGAIEPSTSGGPGPAATGTGSSGSSGEGNATLPPPSTGPAPTQPPSTSTEPTTTKARRDGIEIYLNMCHTTSKSGTMHIWGSVTDTTFQVDEAIIAFDLAPPTSAGALTCSSSPSTNSVVVVFAESRGAEFVANPAICKFAISNPGTTTNIVRGTVSAEYFDAGGLSHFFEVDFAAPPCK